jgi:hypothetical protein
MKTQQELLRQVHIRLVQIASGDYKVCGVFAEDVAKNALPAIDELLRMAGEPKCQQCAILLCNNCSYPQPDE